MPRVLTAGNLSVRVYKGDHAPPHCHVRSPGGKEVVIAIRTGAVLYPTKGPQKAAQALVARHREALLAHWESLNP